MPKGGGTGQAGRGRGDIVIDVPTQAGTFDVTCFIEGYDFASGKWYTILEGANITAGNSTQRLSIAQDVGDVAGLSANDVMPYMWRIRMEHGDATEITYSVAYALS